jgi:hypothetical protein
MPILTIVVPTLNRLSLLKRALDSVLAQTAKVEIIVSDNGSSDGTDDYLKALHLPPHVRLFRHDSTMPVQEHAAFQVSQVETPWVVFLSDDDYIEPAFAQNLIQLIESSNEIRLAYTGCDLIYGEVHVKANVGPRLEKATSFFLGFMEGSRNICLCATAFRTADMRAIGPLPASCVIGDMYYWTRILAADGLVGCVDQHLSNYTFYRPQRTSETNRVPVAAWVQESAVLAALMCQTIREYLPSAAPRMKRAKDRFLALTIANQLTWNALAHRPRSYLLAALVRHAALLSKDVAATLRAFAATLLPPVILERLMLFHARRMALRRRDA